MFVQAVLNNLPGAVPMLASTVGIAILARNFYTYSRGRRPCAPRGVAAFALSQGMVGVAGMVISVCFYELVPNFSPKGFFFFLILYSTLGAAITLIVHQALQARGDWPDLFRGVRQKATSRSPQQNILYSISALVLIYGIFGAFYFLGPDSFVENAKLKTKSRIFVLLFGPWENLLTWAWFASAFIGLIIAGITYVLFFELFWRKN